MNTDCLGTSNCACGIICDLAVEFFGYAANHTAINRNVPHIPFRYVMEHRPKWGNASNGLPSDPSRGAFCILPSTTCPLPLALYHLPSTLYHLPSTTCPLPYKRAQLPAPVSSSQELLEAAVQQPNSSTVQQLHLVTVILQKNSHLALLYVL